MKKAGSVISTVVLIIMVAAVAVFALPRLFGVKMFAVLSGSMEPAYHTGSIVFVVPQDFSELEVGDTVTYVLNEQLVTVTHRIVEIDSENMRVVTHGDANAEDALDAPVMYENIVGKVVFSIPGLGFIATLLSTKYGKLFAVAAILLAAVISFMCGDGGKKSRQDAKPEAETETEADNKPDEKPTDDI